MDLGRSIFAAWNRGDFSSAEWAHAEIEYVLADGPVPGTWTGVTGMEAAFRNWLNAWEDLRSQVDEFRALDDERVAVFFHLIGRGKTSGLELGQMQSQAASLFHVREGKVTRLVHYANRDRALADLGLAPQGGSP
jgi:ketosteroid isomerase-like protein